MIKFEVFLFSIFSAQKNFSAQKFSAQRDFLEVFVKGISTYIELAFCVILNSTSNDILFSFRKLFYFGIFFRNFFQIFFRRFFSPGGPQIDFFPLFHKKFTPTACRKLRWGVSGQNGPIRPIYVCVRPCVVGYVVALVDQRGLGQQVGYRLFPV